MAINVEAYIKTLPIKKKGEIERRAQELMVEEKTLQELRKAVSYSQAQLAQALGVKQATISKMERKTDLYVSSLRSFVEAMGGSLDITANFPHKPPIRIRQFQDFDMLNI